MEPPTIFLFDIILEKPIYNDNCSCEVIARRIITKSELNFFDSLFLPVLPSNLYNDQKLILLEFLPSPNGPILVKNFKLRQKTIR